MCQARNYDDDYPYPNGQIDAVNYEWGFYFRECTDFVAWRMNRDAGTLSSPYAFTNKMRGGRWSDAANWESNAIALNIVVDHVPTPGAVAHWRAGELGPGHVAYVERVNSDGTVDVSEYNYPNAHAFGFQLNVSAPRYIHIDAVALDTSGTLTPSSPSCTISAGASSCNVNLTWTTTNPVGTSAVTSSYPSANTRVFTANSGGPSPASVPYNSRSFFLYNNDKELA
ncbi:MAG TPA: CHAP domain-containing protein, partial [Solimonas sp.]|nr:CHAP domain-containing protein [Solimonas sp.]